MNIERMLAMTDIVVRAHILNWFWRPRVKRRVVRSNVISQVIPKYFKRYLPAINNVPEVEVENNDENDKIFTLWLQGEDNAPPLVKACYRSVRRHCKQELIVLDEKTVFDFAFGFGALRLRKNRSSSGSFAGNPSEQPRHSRNCP